MKATFVCFVTSLLTLISSAFAQSTPFTYQGQLKDSGTVATGTYDLQFRVYDAVTNGNVIGGPLTNAALAISQGLFSVSLDFGAGVFNGNARWIEIGVRTNGDSGAFTLLTPRQSVASAPYAIQSLSAATAAFATNAITAATATTANSVSGTNITGTISAAQLPSSVVVNDGSAVTMTGSLTLPTDGLVVGNSVNQLVTKYNRVGIGRVPFDNASNPISLGGGVVVINPTLEVTNTVSIPGTSYYAYRTAKTLYYTIPAAELVSANPAVYQGRIDEGFSSSTVNGLNSLWATGGTVGTVAYFVAPVHLPHMAVITGLRGAVVKNGGTLQSVVELYRSDSSGYLANTAQLIATASTGSSGGIVWVVNASSVNASYNVVDNANYVYFLRYSGEQNSQSLRFISARITYTVQSVE